MSRRYSIIPAGAVCDPRLEGRDLQVLCFIGTWTDKLGWYFNGQGEVAEQLGCSRSTVQRSLARLIDAGYIQTSVPKGARPHAKLAYRVLMDRDDPKIHSSEFAVDDGGEGDRCAPVHTSPEVRHGCSTAPTQGRAPPPPEVPTHTWAHKDQDSVGGDGGDARARARPPFGPEASRLADDLATIAGHDPACPPLSWMSDGPAIRAQTMLDAGWSPDMMRETAKAIMARKRDGPPKTLRYFEQPFARAHALQSQHRPLPSVEINPRPQEAAHAPRGSTSGWQASRDNWRRAADELRAAVGGQGGSDAGGSQGGERSG